MAIRKQFKDFLKTMGYNEDVTDEMIEEMVNQMSKMLEFDNVGNSINFKTGCIIHQLILKNQADVKIELEDQLRSGSFTVQLPPLKFQLSRTCLNLDDSSNCNILKGWNKSDVACNFINNYSSCEIARNSVDQGLEDLR